MMPVLGIKKVDAWNGVAHYLRSVTERCANRG